MATDDIKYKSYGSGKTRTRRDRDLLSNSYASSGSYLQGYQNGRHKYPIGSSIKSSSVVPKIPTKYGSYDNFSFSSSLPSSYCRKYLESDRKYLESEYKPPPSSARSESFYSPYSSHELPRGIFSSSFDPRASYISDMESREFGSHVDMIQSLQLRCVVMPNVFVY